jgi:uncharacterized protein YoxC
VYVCVAVAAIEFVACIGIIISMYKKMNEKLRKMEQEHIDTLKKQDMIFLGIRDREAKKFLDLKDLMDIDYDMLARQVEKYRKELYASKETIQNLNVEIRSIKSEKETLLNTRETLLNTITKISQSHETVESSASSHSGGNMLLKRSYSM